MKWLHQITKPKEQEKLLSPKQLSCSSSSSTSRTPVAPYAKEPTVAAADPLFSILGFIFFRLIWCIPDALVTAFHAAFAPFWGSLLSYRKFLGIDINNGAYLVLCARLTQMCHSHGLLPWPLPSSSTSSTPSSTTGLTIFG